MKRLLALAFALTLSSLSLAAEPKSVFLRITLVTDVQGNEVIVIAPAGGYNPETAMNLPALETAGLDPAQIIGAEILARLRETQAQPD